MLENIHTPQAKAQQRKNILRIKKTTFILQASY